MPETPDKIKIALVPSPLDSSLKTAIGLGAKHTAVRLAKRDEVVIYTGGSKNFSGEYLAEDGVRFSRLFVEPDRVIRRFSEKCSFLFKKEKPLFSTNFYYPYYGRALAREIAAHGFDIAHIHNFSQFVPVVRARNRTVKIALHMHCDWLTQLDRTMVRKRLEETSLVLGCSDFVTGAIKAGFPEFAGKCRTLYNGVDNSFFKIRRKKLSKGPKRILFIGRISPEKGVHVLADAFRLVSAVFPDLRLDIIGPERLAPPEFLASMSADPLITGLKKFYTGSYSDEIKKRLGPRFLERVTFHGHVANSGMPAYLEKADILVNSAIYETFGVPAAEAMACGVPVVAADYGGLPEVVADGKTGLLAERGNAESLADAVISILKNGDLGERMGAEGKKRALELFSWDNIAVKLRGFYEELFRDEDRSTSPGGWLQS